MSELNGIKEGSDGSRVGGRELFTMCQGVIKWR